MTTPRSEATRLLGMRLRRHRRGLGLTQQEVASLCGLDVANYGRLERGTANPTLETLLLIAATIEMDPGELLAGLAEHIDDRPYTVGDFLRTRPPRRRRRSA